MNIFIIIIFLLICFVQGCKDTEEDFVTDLITIKKGSKLIQGKEYEVIINTKEIKSKKFFAEVYYNFAKDISFSERVFLMEKVDSVHYKFLLPIPPKTSWLIILLSTERETISCPYQFRFPVYRNRNELEFAANEVLIFNSKPNEYLKFFYNERKNYPENLGIYASRWFYEKSNKLLDPDTIRDNLKTLEEKFPFYPDLPLLQLIGYSITFDTAKVFNAIAKILEKPFPSTLLSNFDANAILTTIFRQNYSFRPKIVKRLYEHLAANNAFSHFTSTIISHGILRDTNKFDPGLAISIYNKLLKMFGDLPYIRLQKLRAMVNLLPDSLSYFQNELARLIDLVLQYTTNNDLYEKGKDPSHSFYSTTGLIPTLVLELYKYTKDQEFCLDLLFKLAKIYPSHSANKGLNYFVIGDLYSLMGKSYIDSALKYYYYASHLFPAYKILEKNISKLVNSRNVEKILAIQKKKYGDFTIIFESIPNIQYFDGSKENLDTLKKPKLIVFFNTSCSSCEQMFRDIAQDANIINKIRFFLLTFDQPSQIHNYYVYKMFSTKIITNVSELINYFNLNYNLPNWVILSPDNRLISKGSGYSKNSVNWKEISNKF